MFMFKTLVILQQRQSRNCKTIYSASVGCHSPRCQAEYYDNYHWHNAGIPRNVLKKIPTWDSYN